jgi:uncharacterized protein GlcG (DUF336 family)
MRVVSCRAALALVVSTLAASPATVAAQGMPNPYGGPITTEVARKAAIAALGEARKNGWTIYATVVDTGGIVVYVERIDGVQYASAEISTEKARTAVMFKRPSKLIEERIAAGQNQYLKLPGATPIQGGVPILVEGKVVGAIGVSGATSAQDHQCAQAGADAVSPPPPASPPPAAPAPAR